MQHGLPPITQLIIVSVVLGVVVSWAATALWNAASARMSSTAAGMLINIETVAGYAYVCAAARRLPPVGQLAGFALILMGVVLVIRLPAKATLSTNGRG
jgi:drug/metabolite transporter (DMT)-like permease